MRQLMVQPGLAKAKSGKGPRGKRQVRALRARAEAQAADRETHRSWLPSRGSR